MNTIKQELEDFTHSCPIKPGDNLNFQHFVLANGTECIRHPSPHRFIASNKTRGQCFKNAFLLVTKYRDDLQYAEGYVRTSHSPMAILHAWAVTPSGECIDPTLTDGTDYFGVSFDYGYVKSIAFGADTFSGVIDNYHDNWPLLTGVHTDWRPKNITI